MTARRRLRPPACLSGAPSAAAVTAPAKPQGEARNGLPIPPGSALFETLTDLLAETLVLEHQRRQKLAEPTGVSPGGTARTRAKGMVGRLHREEASARSDQPEAVGKGS